MGLQGEAAKNAAEIILCREANRPIQFSINAPAPQSMSQFVSRAASDIIGKKAGRLVMGLGLRALRRSGGKVEVVSKDYCALAEVLVNKMQCDLHFLTIPEDMLPEARIQVAALNETIRGFKELAPTRVFIWDFANHAAEYKEKQIERGKFARSLYNETGCSTSLGNMLMALFLHDNIVKIFKKG